MDCRKPEYIVQQSGLIECCNAVDDLFIRNIPPTSHLVIICHCYDNISLLYFRHLRDTNNASVHLPVLDHVLLCCITETIT